MASKRQERLLERQRGAGTRQIKNTGFDLLFPGHDNAAAAPLIPQKSGRSRRTPEPELLPQKSGRSRKTPQPELLPQRSTRRNPAAEGLPQQPSFGRRPIIPNAKKRGRSKTILEVEEGKAQRHDGQEAAAKRRKLNNESTNSKAAKESVPTISEVATPEVQVRDSQPDQPDQNSLPTGSPKKRKKRKSIGQQSLRRTKSQGKSPLRPANQPQKRGRKPKPPQPTVPVFTRTPEPPEYSRITTSALRDKEQSQSTAMVEAVEGGNGDVELLENLGKEEVVAVEPKSSKRKQEPIQKEARRRVNPKVAKGPVPEALEGDASPAGRIPPKTEVRRGPKPGLKGKTVNGAVQSRDPTEQHEAESSQSGEKVSGNVQGVAGGGSEDIAVITKAPESQDKPKPRRKKRKSISQQSTRPRKKATDTANPDKPTSGKASITKSVKEPTPKTKAAASSKSPKTKPAQLPTPADKQLPNNIDDLSNGEVLELEPAQLKKKRGRPRKTDAPSIPPPPTTETAQPRAQNPRPRKPNQPPKNTIPITYYAPPSPSASDSDAMMDPLSNPQPAPSTTKTINAVDVLAQTCLEMLSKTSASLADKALSSPDQKAEYTRRKKTVDMYSDELEDRLFQLTTTLNKNTSLAAQVRQAGAQERRLKKEIKALEAEREKVRVRKEEVMKAKKARELELLLNGIKGAVEKGLEMEAKAKIAEG